MLWGFRSPFVLCYVYVYDCFVICVSLRFLERVDGKSLSVEDGKSSDAEDGKSLALKDGKSDWVKDGKSDWVKEGKSLLYSILVWK